MIEIKPRQWADAKFNQEFICIETYSGYASARGDYKGAQHLLSPNARDMDIGEAVRDALSRSRFVLPAPRRDVWIHPKAGFDMELYDRDLNAQRYDEWVASLMQRYGYKTKRALFKDMMSCSIESVDGWITIRPWHHEKLEAWSGDGISENDFVTVAVDSAPEVIGAALRLAFSRCT